MELRHIRYFLAVADELNFTRAAAKVGIGQPPLSQQIKDLENEVGTSLFHRTSHGVELTEAGRAFMDLVKSLPSQAHFATLAAQRAARGEVGSLRIGFSGSAVFSTCMPEAIRTFRRTYPDVLLTLEESNSSTLIRRLRDGELDVIYIRPDGSTPPEGLAIRLVSTEPLLAVLPTSHAAGQAHEIRLAQLREDAFVLFPRIIGPIFETTIAACLKAGFEPILGPTAQQIGSIMVLVAAECGISILPASMMHLQMEGVVFKTIQDEPLSISLGLAHRRGEMSKAVRNFLAVATAL